MSKLSNVAYRSESAHKCTQGTEQCHGCRRMSGSYITQSFSLLCQSERSEEGGNDVQGHS